MKASGLADSPLFKKPKARKQPHHHATTIASDQDTMVATVQTNLMEIGKEAATYRLTRNEKKKIAEIVYSLKMKNIRITENEIIRIALNALLYDYEKDKSESILKNYIQHRTPNAKGY
jgi:PAB1-binding protein PBP1